MFEPIVIAIGQVGDVVLADNCGCEFHGAMRHPITLASIAPPIAELRHTPWLQ